MMTCIEIDCKFFYITCSISVGYKTLRVCKISVCAAARRLAIWEDLSDILVLSLCSLWIFNVVLVFDNFV